MSALFVWKWLTNSDFRPGGTRERMRNVLRSAQFELTMGCVTALNIVLIVYEVDVSAAGVHSKVVKYANRVFLFAYVLELALRFYVLRLLMFKDPYTVVDFLVVAIDMVVALVSLGHRPQCSTIRMVRLAKLSRTKRLFAWVPELELMLKGLWGAFMSIFWGAVLCSTVLLFWSILAVDFIRPTNDKVVASGYYVNSCERCPRAYATVWDSALTIIQSILFGDSWGAYAMPIIEQDPRCLLFFLLVYVTINLAVLNLILALICDSAQQARQLCVKDETKQKEAAFMAAKKRLEEICASLDSDHTGCITLTQLQSGLKTNDEFSDIMTNMDIRSEDLPAVFGAMDRDGSGDVSTDEFTQELYRLLNNDTIGMLVHMKHSMSTMRKQMVESFADVRSLIDLQARGGNQKVNHVFDSDQRVLEDTTSAAQQHGFTGMPLPIAASERGDANRLLSNEAPANVDVPGRSDFNLTDGRDDLLPRIVQRLDEISNSISHVFSEMQEIHGDIGRSTRGHNTGRRII